MKTLIAGKPILITTSGTGQFTNKVKEVAITRIIAFAWRESYESFDRCRLSRWVQNAWVYYDPETWNSEVDGYIEGDPRFDAQLKAYLRLEGCPEEVLSSLKSADPERGSNSVRFTCNVEFIIWVADRE